MRWLWNKPSSKHALKWNEWGLRPPLRTCRLNWAKGASWDESDDTALQTQNLKFDPLRSEAEHATSWSQRLPTILNIYKWAEKKHVVSLKLECQSGSNPRSPTFQAGSFNHCTSPPPPTSQQTRYIYPMFDQCWPTVYDVGPTLVKHWVTLAQHWSNIG